MGYQLCTSCLLFPTVIDNEDGSRYNADGTRHSGDSSTSGVDDENLGSGSIHDTTPGDASIRRSSPSYYGSVTPYSHMPDHSSGGGEKDFPVKHYGKDNRMQLYSFYKNCVNNYIAR